MRVRIFGAVLLALLGLMVAASARDLGQWTNQDPAIRRWFESLMMPDHPTTPCCGVADGYWADSFEVNGDRYVAIITDTRPDEPLRRPHIAPGTRIEVPNQRIKWDRGNPTGHGWLFVSSGVVFCYLPPTGI